LVLALGSSLSGMNADSIGTDVTERYLKGDALGLVIVNL